MREEMRQRREEKIKSVRFKAESGLGMRLLKLFTLGTVAFQLALIAFIYAFFAIKFRIFFYVSLGLTVLNAVYIFISEKDAQCKASWLILMVLSCGSGYIIYLLADKRVCYGAYKRRFDGLYSRSRPYVGAYCEPNASQAVKNDCGYLYNAGGFAARSGTDIKYFNSGKAMFENMLARLETAKKFVFIEFFIIAEGVLLERLLNVLKRRIAEGVEVKFIYDDEGSLGAFTPSTKKRMRKMGIQLKVFSQMLSLFSFGLNYRDHRKVVVIDGETAYAGGCNLSDQYVNQHRMEGFWKDAGVRLDGAAVDDMSLIFLRQWDFICGKKTGWDGYLNRFTATENKSVVAPYAGGPDLDECVCRGIYANAISGAREKLYIMTPYFIPDGALADMLKAKALSGADVRIVLPGVPDWRFVYKVTVSNAEALIASGVKIYFADHIFVHSKVMLTENCAIVGSVNIDMRAFYEEFDNGVYTDDAQVMSDIDADFSWVFERNDPAVRRKRNVFDKAVVAFLKIFSPLM